MVHLILHTPDDHLLTGPAGNIAPNLKFDSKYHGYISENHRYNYT